MDEDDPDPQPPVPADPRGWLALALFFAGFGGMIWAIGSAVDLF